MQKFLITVEFTTEGWEYQILIKIRYVGVSYQNAYEFVRR